MRPSAMPIRGGIRVVLAWCTDIWRLGATIALVLLILYLPLPRHWLLVERRVFPIYYEFTSFLFYLSDAVLILLLTATALWVWRSRPSIRWGPEGVTLPLALLPLIALLTAPWAGDRGLALYVAVRLTALLAAYLAIVALQPSARAVQLGLAVSVLLQAAVAVVQFVLQDDLGWWRLGEIELTPQPGRASIITVGSRVWLRGYGLTPHPNILGGVLVTMLLALVVPYLECRGRRRVAWLAVLALGGAGLIVSFSRAAWLGGLVGGSVLLLGVLSHRPWRRRYGRVVLIPIAIGVVGLAGFAFWQRDLLAARLTAPASYTESRSLDERRVLADASLLLIRHSPVVGVGAGNFSAAVMPVVRGIPGTTPQPVHNLPLLLSAELGLGGGVVWAWLMLAPPILAWRCFRAGRLNLWALGLTAGLVALAVIDLFDFYSWGWPQGRLLRWVYLGLWSSALGTSAE